MRPPRRLAPFLVGFVLLIFAELAHAQPRSEKKTYVALPPDGDLSQILNDKLLEKRGWLELRKLLDKAIQQGGGLPLPEKRLKGLDLDRLKQDPKLRQQIQEWLGKQAPGDLKPNPDQLKAIERALESKPPVPPDGRKLPADPIDPPDVPLQHKGDSGPKPALPAANPQVPAAADPELQERLARWAQDVWKDAEHSRLGERLLESPAWQRAVRDLKGILSDRLPGKLNLPAQGLDRLQLPKGMNLSLPDLGRLKMPNVSLPSVPRPKLNLSLPGFGGWAPRRPGGFPGLQGAGAIGGGLAALEGLLWVALVVLVAFLLWRFVGRTAWQARRPLALDAQLGPWPVNPARVSTKAELVRAFEYLALLLLGPEARTRNHHEIAGGLVAAADSGDKGAAAVELAVLYEQARYAPGDEPFADAEIAAARRNLCLLAGVAAA